MKYLKIFENKNNDIQYLGNKFIINDDDIDHIYLKINNERYYLISNEFNINNISKELNSIFKGSEFTPDEIFVIIVWLNGFNLDIYTLRDDYYFVKIEDDELSEDPNIFICDQFENLVKFIKIIQNFEPLKIKDFIMQDI